MYFGTMRFDGNKAIRYTFNRTAEHAIRMKNNEFYDYYLRLFPYKKRRTVVTSVAHKMIKNKLIIKKIIRNNNQFVKIILKS